MDIAKLLRELTLEEKASLCSGGDFWHTKAIERLGIPAIMLADGPHGLRKQDQVYDHLGIKKSIEAVCFPAACGLAASFDRALARRLGEILGDECQAEGIAVLLGPAANIKRTPLCGRNFEYFSEDPCLTAQLAASYIEGVQSKHVGTSIKHFAANNQEYRRMSFSSEVEPRALHEIYLAAFEDAVRTAKPYSVMCAYNRVNGDYASENEALLHDVLRRRWGFEGAVVTDWGACTDRVKGLRAGQDLEMPESFGLNDRAIVQAVQDGTLDERVLDDAVARVLALIEHTTSHRDPAAKFDRAAHSKIAREIARECMVLLKNDGVLPLARTQRIAMIGEFARAPRFQGSGSSFINASRVVNAWDAAQEAGCTALTYARGYATDDAAQDETLREEAIAAAQCADIAVIFAGLPAQIESEGFDRKDLRLPENQNALISAVCRVQPRTVVVLHHGAPVEMPWVHEAAAILDAYLGGQEVGGAVIDLLLGDANPCGKLAETYPLRLADTPAYLSYPGENGKVRYREGVFVGYRYYDARRQDVLFPFGHGLSYTSFSYSDLSLSTATLSENETLTVSLTVTNTGARAGKEIIQLYVGDRTETVARPPFELRDFCKVSLAPGQQTRVSFRLARRAFAFFDEAIDDFFAAPGRYELAVGRSSRDLPLRAELMLAGRPRRLIVTRSTTLGDLLACAQTRPIITERLGAFIQKSLDPEGNRLGKGTAGMRAAMIDNLPLHALRSFGVPMEYPELDALVETLNRAQDEAPLLF